MSKCPNWSHPGMQVLVENIGKDNAYLAYIKNDDTTPSLDQAYDLLGMEPNGSSTKTTLSKDTQEKLENFLTKRGIDIINFTKEEALTYGKQWGLTKRNMAVGVADTVNGIIALLDGKQDIAFGEEAAHMTVAMLKQSNPKLAREMFDKITKMEIYKKVLQDPAYLRNPNYRLKDGKIDIEAIKEEAIGKLVSEHLANETGRASKLQDFERVLGYETPEKVSQFQRWFDKALNWFKQLFNKYDDNPFKETAKQMLGTSKNEFEGTKGDLTKDNKTLLQTTDERDEKLDYLRKQNKATSLLDGKFKYNDKDVRFKADDSIIGMKSNKGAKALAEKGRLDVKDILDRYINEDGTLRTTPLDKTSTSNLDPGREKAYEVLERNIAARLASFPEGTKFMNSTNIYNGGDKPDVNGKAAYLDLIAMTPDGKANIYNFEFIRLGENVTDGDIPLDQQNAAREYMKDAKAILVKGYKITKFGESRTIPVKIGANFGNNGKDVTYVPDSIEISGVKSDLKDKPYVRPIPTFDERTGYKSLDKLIDKFLDLYETKEKSSKVEARKGQMDQIARAIRHMQLDMGVPVLAFQADSATKIAIRATADFVDNVRNLAPEDVSIDDLAAKAWALDMRETDLMIYKDAYLHYKDREKEATEEEKEDLKTLKEASDKASEALFELRDARREFAAFICSKWHEFNADAPEKELSFYGRFLRPFNKPTTAAQTTFYRLKTETNTTIEHRIRGLATELEGIESNLNQWLKGKKYTDMLDVLKEKDSKGNRTNRLIKQYHGEFYEKWEEAVDEDTPTSRTWMRKNIDMEAFRKWLTDRALKKREEINASYPKSERTPGSPWYKEVQNINKFNKPSNDKALYMYGKKFPAKTWETDEFKNLNDPKNKPIKDYYDFLQKVNGIAAESGYIDWDRSKRFLPFIYKSFMEAKMIGGEFSKANSILRAMTVSDMDLNYGQVNKITNERFESLPKFFTVETGREVVDKDGKKHLDYSTTSEDMLANTFLYMMKVVEYDEHAKIEPLVKSLLWLEKNKDSLQTNYLGRVIEGSEPKHDNSKNYEAFKDIVSNQLYQKAYTNKQDLLSKEANAGESYNKLVDKVNNFTGLKILHKVDEGGRYSFVKTIDAIKNFQVLKTLGLNVSVPLYRMLSTNIQAYIHAGEYYNHLELSKAELRHGALQFTKSNAALHLLLMKTFLPVDTQLGTEARQMSMSRWTRDTLPDFMMKLTQRAHDWIQYVNFDAMLNNAIVIDGKVVNARKYVREQTEFADRYGKNFDERRQLEKGFEDKVKALIDEHGLIKKASEKDGKLVIDGVNLNDPSITKYMNMTRNMGLKLSGNITKENEVNARRNAFIRQFFMYKSWLLGMVETRYTPLSWKEGEESYQWGRIRMVAKIASENLVTSMSRLTSMVRGTDKGVQMMSDLYDKQKTEYEDEHGKAFNMSREQFYDMVRKGIQQEVKEIAAQLLLLGGCTALYGAVKNVDKDKKGAVAFAARLIDRSYEELNMYYNPASMQNIANGSLLPALAFPLDVTKAIKATVEYTYGASIGDNEVKEKARIHKHLIKLLPVTSQLPNWAGIVFPEYMKQLGYHPDAEQMHH